MINIQIPDQTYQSLQQAAQARGVTPEALIEWFVASMPLGFARNADEFFRALGSDDDEITQIKELAKQLPENPDW